MKQQFQQRKLSNISHAQSQQMFQLSQQLSAYKIYIPSRQKNLQQIFQQQNINSNQNQNQNQNKIFTNKIISHIALIIYNQSNDQNKIKSIISSILSLSSYHKQLLNQYNPSSIINQSYTINAKQIIQSQINLQSNYQNSQLNKRQTKHQNYSQHILTLQQSNLHKYNRVTFLLLNASQSKTKFKFQKNLQFINKLVAISDQIILINLNTHFQNIIQKQYLQMLDYSYRFQNTKRLSLTIINQNHKKDSLSKQGIKYRQTINSQLIIKPLYCQNIPLTLNQIVQLLHHQKKQSQNHYQTSNNINNAKTTLIKFTLEKYLKLQKIKQKAVNAEQMLFQSKRQKTQIQRQINRMKLPKKIYDHLMWKSNQLNLYKTIIEQSKQNNLKQYNLMTFKNIDDQICKSGIQVFGRKWMSNSFLKLKEIFNKIANRRDLKTIKQFSDECSLYQRALHNLQAKFQQKNKKKQKQIISNFKQELETFIWYHNQVIKGQFMSSWLYYKQQTKYLWRNDRTIYRKSLILVLIIILALLQDDIILGLTLLSVGVTFLAIRI